MAAIKARRQKSERRGGGRERGSGGGAQPHRTAPPVPGHRSPSFTVSDLRREKCTFPRSRRRADVPSKDPVSFPYNMSHSGNYLLGRALSGRRGGLLSPKVRGDQPAPPSPIRQLELVQTKTTYFPSGVKARRQITAIHHRRCKLPAAAAAGSIISMTTTSRNTLVPPAPAPAPLNHSPPVCEGRRCPGHGGGR